MSKKVVLIVVAVIGITLMLAKRFPYAISSFDAKMNVVYLLLIAVSFALSFKRFNSTSIINSMAIWVVIIIVLVAGYTNKDYFKKLASAFLPNQIITLNNGSLVLTAEDHGHFFVEISVNDQPINCLIDTGASEVVLSAEQAQLAGLNLSQLNYDIPIQTANGQNNSARAKLNKLTVGSIIFYDFNILVNSTSMDECLLGMSFLKKLSSFTVDGNKLIMVP